VSSKPEVEGTYLFGLDDSRRAYPLNKLCASLKTEQNRASFVGDEAAYCDRFGLTPELREAVLTRDWVGMLDLGASIFYIFKLAQVDKVSVQYLGGIFTGMSTEEFIAELKAGGRHFG
jgi:protocatechuate 4,5-dioxygenase alpha chain